MCCVRLQNRLDCDKNQLDLRNVRLDCSQNRLGQKTNSIVLRIDSVVVKKNRLHCLQNRLGCPLNRLGQKADLIVIKIDSFCATFNSIVPKIDSIKKNPTRPWYKSTQLHNVPLNILTFNSIIHNLLTLPRLS